MSSLDILRRDVQRSQEEIAKLLGYKAGEARRAADYAKKASDAAQSASRASSVSSMQSRIRDAERHERDRQRAAEKVADYDKKIATEQSRLANVQQRLAKAEAEEAKKQQRSVEDAFREQQRRSNQLAGGLAEADHRHAELDQRVRQLESLPEKIVVLFLAANPPDENQLRLDEEVRAITENIRKSKHRDSVKLESCWAIRPHDVLQAINEHRPCVVHFSGHGTQAGEIVFHDNAGQSKYVTKEAIVQLMAASSGDIRLVVFNTCFSHGQASAVVKSVDAAIGMTASISDDVARTFAGQLYSAIGFGLSVGSAFEQAKALVMMEGLGEHDVPQLSLREGLLASEIVLVAPPGM